MEQSSYSKSFYALLGASVGGILVGGYLTVQNFFSGAKQEPSLIIKNSFEMALDNIKEEFAKNNKSFNEEILIKIIALIKEYADYLFEKRNKLNIHERRSIYKKLIKKE